MWPSPWLTVTGVQERNFCQLPLRQLPHKILSGFGWMFVCLLVGCLMSQQHASVSQGWICHTEIEVADQTFYLTHSQYTDTGPTSPSADPITPGHWSANFFTGMTRPWKIPAQAGFEPRIFRSRGRCLTTRPTRQLLDLDGIGYRGIPTRMVYLK